MVVLQLPYLRTACSSAHLSAVLVPHALLSGKPLVEVRSGPFIGILPAKDAVHAGSALTSVASSACQLALQLTILGYATASNPLVTEVADIGFGLGLDS
jgi:hypothetical protein